MKIETTANNLKVNIPVKRSIRDRIIELARRDK